MPDGNLPHSWSAGSGLELGPAGASRRQRVLVLGAGGFIGSRIVKALAATSWALPIAAGHRFTPRTAGAQHAIRLDATDARTLQAALQGVAAVVNCVAGDAQTIVDGARVLFESCARAMPPPRVVHLSTMAVYGSATGTVDETAPLKGDLDRYSAAKATAEQLSRVCENVVHLRPGIVYGPGSPIWSERIAGWLKSQRLGDLGRRGVGICNLVHVDDVVQATLRALHLQGIEGQAFNLSLPSPPTWNEYFRLYAQALNVPLRRISGRRLMLETLVLAPPLKMAQWAARAGHLDWNPPAPIRPWLLHRCRHEIRLDVRKAERLLGVQWTDLHVGIAHTGAHYRQRQRAADGHQRLPGFR